MALSPGDTDETVYGEAIPNTTHRYRYKKSAFPQPLPTLPMSKEVAFEYMCNCMVTELRMRVCDARVATFVSRLGALSVLTKFFREHPLSLADWHKVRNVTLRPMTWSHSRNFSTLSKNMSMWEIPAIWRQAHHVGCILPEVPVRVKPKQSSTQPIAPLKPAVVF